MVSMPSEWYSGPNNPWSLPQAHGADLPSPAWQTPSPWSPLFSTPGQGYGKGQGHTFAPTQTALVWLAGKEQYYPQADKPHISTAADLHPDFAHIGFFSHSACVKFSLCTQRTALCCVLVLVWTMCNIITPNVAGSAVWAVFFTVGFCQVGKSNLSLAELQVKKPPQDTSTRK